MLGGHKAAHADDLVCDLTAFLLSMAEPTIAFWDARGVACLMDRVAMDSALASD